MISRNIDESNIYVYGFAFQGKNVLIRGGAHETLDLDTIGKENEQKT